MPQAATARRAPARKQEPSDLLALQLRALCTPRGIAVVSELTFAKPRRFRFDFCLVDYRIAVEVEGGIFVGGRHTSPRGYSSDCVKYNLAVLHGYHLLRFTSEQVRDGTAITTIEEALRVFAPVALPPSPEPTPQPTTKAPKPKVLASYTAPTDPVALAQFAATGAPKPRRRRRRPSVPATPPTPLPVQQKGAAALG